MLSRASSVEDFLSPSVSRVSSPGWSFALTRAARRDPDVRLGPRAEEPRGCADGRAAERHRPHACRRLFQCLESTRRELSQLAEEISTGAVGPAEQKCRRRRCTHDTTRRASTQFDMSTACLASAGRPVAHARAAHARRARAGSTANGGTRRFTARSRRRGDVTTSDAASASGTATAASSASSPVRAPRIVALLRGGGHRAVRRARMARARGNLGPLPAGPRPRTHARWCTFAEAPSWARRRSSPTGSSSNDSAPGRT
jgi:hypothetical protein